MARPQKQTVDYFPHDTDASESKTLTIIQSKYGNDGYAFWFKLLQLLGKSPGHYFDFNKPADWEFLLAKTHIKDTETAKVILDTLSLLDAIDPELYQNGIIWCQKFVDRIADAYGRTVSGVPQRPKIGVSVPKNGETANGNPEIATEIPQTKLKETKLKETIYIVIFTLWNEQKIIVHKKLTDDIKWAIGRALKEHSQEETSQAIKNYAEILKGDQYYFKYSWTLKDFLKRGLEKFLELKIAQQNYLSEKGGPGGAHKPRPRALKRREDYISPEQHRDNARGS